MNQTTKLIIVMAASAGTLGASNAIAQRSYDPKTVETIQGKVLSVEKTLQKVAATESIHREQKPPAVLRIKRPSKPPN